MQGHGVRHLYLHVRQCFSHHRYEPGTLFGCQEPLQDAALEKKSNAMNLILAGGWTLALLLGLPVLFTQSVGASTDGVQHCFYTGFGGLLCMFGDIDWLCYPISHPGCVLCPGGISALPDAYNE